MDFGKLLNYGFILLFYFLLGLLCYFLHLDGIYLGVNFIFLLFYSNVLI